MKSRLFSIDVSRPNKGDGRARSTLALVKLLFPERASVQ